MQALADRASKAPRETYVLPKPLRPFRTARNIRTVISARSCGATQERVTRSLCADWRRPRASKPRPAKSW